MSKASQVRDRIDILLAQSEYLNDWETTNLPGIRDCKSPSRKQIESVERAEKSVARAKAAGQLSNEQKAARTVTFSLNIHSALIMGIWVALGYANGTTEPLTNAKAIDRVATLVEQMLAGGYVTSKERSRLEIAASRPTHIPLHVLYRCLIVEAAQAMRQARQDAQDTFDAADVQSGAVH
jgi:hypothetical protein